MNRDFTRVGTLLGCLFVLATSRAVASAADYPHASEPIGTVRQVYDGTLFPDIQVNTFRNIDRLFPTRRVPAGEHPYPLPEAPEKLPNFLFHSRGKDYDLYDFVSLNRVSGLLVVNRGQVVFEEYFLGNNRQTRWMSMSIAKSITSTLIGMAIRDGYISSLDDPLTDYLPQLVGSAYDGVSVRNLLQMASGVAWNETYTDPTSDRRSMLEAQITGKPGGILELMAALDRAAPPGSRWNYSTGETQVAGALVAAATGRPVAEYLAEKIWIPFGMESDASWWLESPDGLEIGGSGLSATLRDYARFGLFMLGGGVIDGQPTLPEGWIEEATTAKTIGGETVEYGYMWWPLDHGAYAAIGIFGQFVYVRPDADLVVSMWSAQPKPVGTDVIDEYDFFNALALVLDPTLQSVIPVDRTVSGRDVRPLTRPRSSPPPGVVRSAKRCDTKLGNLQSRGSRWSQIPESQLLSPHACFCWPEPCWPLHPSVPTAWRTSKPAFPRAGMSITAAPARSSRHS